MTMSGDLLGIRLLYGVRGAAFDQCDGFDESFFVHMEEIDLCWRMQNAGYTISYFPHSVVWHVGGGTLGYGSPDQDLLQLPQQSYHAGQEPPGKASAQNHPHPTGS
jgi:hypothetical protein